MNQATRGFDKLHVVQKNLQTQAIQDLLTPPHPTQPDVKLRVGISKRGYLMRYAPTGQEGENAWRQFDQCDKKLSAALEEHLPKLSGRLGPAGCRILFYEPED